MTQLIILFWGDRGSWQLPGYWLFSQHLGLHKTGIWGGGNAIVYSFILDKSNSHVKDKFSPGMKSVSLKEENRPLSSQAWGPPCCSAHWAAQPRSGFSAPLFWSVLLALPSPVVHIQRSIRHGNHTWKQKNKCILKVPFLQMLVKNVNCSWFFF